MSPTKIEWSEETWNPTTGCDRVSPGCAHCYALTLAGRLKVMGQPRYQKDGGRASGPGFGLTLHPDALELPLRWKRPRRVFVDSMSDLFHELVPDDFIDRVFAVMALTPQHTYQVLTKRPERMREYMRDPGVPGRVDFLKQVIKAGRLAELDQARNIISGKQWTPDYAPEWPLPGVWLGVTAENQHWADVRIPILLGTPAAVRFVSAEPLLGAIDLLGIKGFWHQCSRCGGSMSVPVNGGGTACPDCYLPSGQGWLPGLDWVIVGGESGPRHRPFNPDWARSIVAQCRDAGVAAFVKQLGGARSGNKIEDLPPDLRVREYPRDLPPPASKESV